MKSKLVDRSSSNTIFKSVLYFVFNMLPESIFYNCGYGDRHVGIYASLYNWRPCYYYYLPFLYPSVKIPGLKAKLKTDQWHGYMTRSSMAAKKRSCQK